MNNMFFKIIAMVIVAIGLFTIIGGMLCIKYSALPIFFTIVNFLSGACCVFFSFWLMRMSSAK